MSTRTKTSDSRRKPEALSSLVQSVLAECAAGRVEQDDMISMLEGIKKYQSLDCKRCMDELPAIWTKGHVRLLHGKGQEITGKTSASLFIVPSMINKYTILDLLPEKSFVRWLMSKGYDVYILDWGLDKKDGKENHLLQNMDTAIGVFLREAAFFAAKLSSEEQQQIHALGYCMGGTLLAALSVLEPDFFASCIYLASPWDFHAGHRKLTDQVLLGMPSAFQMIEAENRLPMEWIQSLFVRLDPQQAIHKYARFNRYEKDSDEARLFIAVEDWLNDGVHLPADIARVCIEEWYAENLPCHGKWRVCDREIDLLASKVPSLVIASRQDRLVPWESSMALAKDRNVSVATPSCGHIGMMVGRRAETEGWSPVLNWLQNAL